MNTIAIEDLVTICLETFIEGAYEIAGSDDIVIEDWYRDLTDDEKRKVSEEILNMIERQHKKRKDG